MSRSKTAAMAHNLPDVGYAESAFVVLAEDERNSYKDAMNSPNAAEWRPACEAEYNVLMGYHTGNLSRNPQAATSSDVDGPSESKETT